MYLVQGDNSEFRYNNIRYNVNKIIKNGSYYVGICSSDLFVI